MRELCSISGMDNIDKHNAMNECEMRRTYLCKMETDVSEFPKIISYFAKYQFHEINKQEK